MAWVVRGLITNLEHMKATSSHKTPVIVFNNIIPELSPILAMFVLEQISMCQMYNLLFGFLFFLRLQLTAQYCLNIGPSVSLMTSVNFLEIIIDNFVVHINSKILLYDKQCRFSSDTFNADVLTFITHRIDNKYISKTVALHIEGL